MNSSMPRAVSAKWGFGMAPVKPTVQEARSRAAALVYEVLSNGASSAAGRSDAALESFSTLKGLFGRAIKSDQWDWFTVWSQFDYPGRAALRASHSAMTAGRNALIYGSSLPSPSADTWRALERYLELIPAREIRPPSGYIYVLSTREDPTMLKVGFTTVDPFTRVGQINAATGVAVPFGVRKIWRVSDARSAERKVHALLDDHRVRADREFFRIPFSDAAPRIESELAAASYLLP